MARSLQVVVYFLSCPPLNVPLFNTLLCRQVSATQSTCGQGHPKQAKDIHGTGNRRHPRVQRNNLQDGVISPGHSIIPIRPGQGAELGTSRRRRLHQPDIGPNRHPGPHFPSRPLPIYVLRIQDKQYRFHGLAPINRHSLSWHLDTRTA